MSGFRVHGGGTTGGGGGTAVINWGPNFGTLGGDSLPQVQSIRMPALELGPAIAQVQSIRNPALALGTALAQPQAIAMPAVALGAALAQPQTLRMPTLGLGPSVAQVQTLRNPALALGTGVSQPQTLGGKVLGQPFWQSQQGVGTTPASVTSKILSRPSGTVNGDLLVAFIGCSHNVNNPDIDTLAGWTLIRHDENLVSGGAASNSHVRSFWKIAASEPTTYTFTLTAAALNATGGIHRINAAHATTPIDAHAGSTLLASALDPDPSAPAITTVANNCMVFAFLYHDHLLLNQTHTAPANHVERTDYESDNATTNTVVSDTSATRTFATPALQGAVEFNCTEVTATDAIMQRVSIAPGELTIA